MQFKQALPSVIANFRLVAWCQVVVTVLSLNLSAHVLANKVHSMLLKHVIH
jgi:hypothetical protein